jgi:DnaJ homolog subfamily C member 8
MANDKEDADIFDDLEKEAKEFDKASCFYAFSSALTLNRMPRLIVLTAPFEAWFYINTVTGILNAFRLDAYAVLDLQPGVPESDIKMTYRKKSLLIHPDKTKNPRAPDAFDRLKKAQTELMDEKLRARLDESIADARMLLIRERKWTVDTPELQSDEFRKAWREKTKEVLIDDELRRRKQMKAQMQEEGRQQRKEDEEIQERKRKREHEQTWEATREQRIESWRDFKKGKSTDGDKKKKKKMKVLG